MNYTTKELAEITHSTLIGNPDVVVKHLAFDSRTIYSVKNTAFIAISTQKDSGENYITSAIEKGIKIIITENTSAFKEGITYIVTQNAIEFLQSLAQYHLNQFNALKTIGVTGSNGKTIVKEWLYQSLHQNYHVVKSPKSFNSQIGLPLSILEIEPNHEIGIFEVGISKPNEMATLEAIFPPKIGVLTHIGSAHLSNFKNEEQLIDEKLQLFKHSETIIYNGDHPTVVKKIQELCPEKKLISFGFLPHNTINIIGDYTDKSKNVEVKIFDEKFSFPAKKRDLATLSNALAVVSVLKELNYSNKEIILKIAGLQSIKMRLESIEGVRNNLIINDSYNLDLDSLKIAYQFIQEYHKPKKVLILTDFVETKNAEELYHEVAELTNAQHFDTLFLIGEEITKRATLFESNTYTFPSVAEVIESNYFNEIEDALILLKGARKFEIETLKKFLELQKHDTILEIDLNAIIHNINVHRSLLKPSTKIMAMVKAFSYGLGGYEIAEFLQHHHIDYLTVAYADEGIELRKNGITTPIMVMNPEQNSYGSIIDYNLEPEIYSFRLLQLFSEELEKRGMNRQYPIHIKLETGMHRLGFKTNELDELIKELKQHPVKVQSIFSHLSTADRPEEKVYTLQQIKIYDENSSYLIEHLGYRPIRHILNSSGIANFSEYQFDMVRIGIGMIGISDNIAVQQSLQCAVEYKTVVSQISNVKTGDSVGYSRKYKAPHDTRIATLPVGYADGIPRLIGNGKGKVQINDVMVPIVGNICMDMIMVNLEELPAQEGDKVIIFDDVESLKNFANYCETIPYEVLTSISRRVKRVYIKK